MTEETAARPMMWRRAWRRWVAFWARDWWIVSIAPGRRMSYGRRHLRNAVLAGLALFLLAEADPFGADDAMERYSAEIFQRWAARSYERSSSDAIRVVLLTDRYYQDRSGSWPLPFRVHADLLSAIFYAGPAAVFVDFGFLDQRNDPSVDHLADVIAMYAEAGVPLYFVSGRPGPGRRHGIVDELAMANLVSGAFWPGRYELFDCRRGLRSGALALAEELLAKAGAMDLPRHLSAGACPAPDAIDEGASWPYRPPACPGNLQGGDPRLCMDLSWSDWEGDALGNGAQRCKDLPSGLRLVLDPFVDFLGRLGLPFGEPVGGQTCGPHRSVTATDLALAESQGRFDEISEFFKGRAVLYGGSIEMSDDLFQPPTHHPLPGVYYHAMALDNLLSLGPSDYKVQQPHIGGRDVGVLVDALTFVLLTTVTGFFARAASEAGAAWTGVGEGYWRRLRCFLLYSLLWLIGGGLTILLIVALLVAAEYLWLDWAAANFVELIAFQGLWWITYLRLWVEKLPSYEGGAG